MKSSVEIYNRIIEAAEKGKSVRLSHQECQTVASDQAIIDAVNSEEGREEYINQTLMNTVMKHTDRDAMIEVDPLGDRYLTFIDNAGVRHNALIPFETPLDEALKILKMELDKLKT